MKAKQQIIVSQVGYIRACLDRINEEMKDPSVQLQTGAFARSLDPAKDALALTQSLVMLIRNEIGGGK